MPATPPTVVLVDDQESIAIEYERAWRNAARIVGVADDGPSAVAVAAYTRPSVVVMDVTVPGSPWVAIRRIVEDFGAPVIVATGMTLPEVADRAADVGASGLVAKSVSTDELLSAVHAVARGNEHWGTLWQDRFKEGATCPSLVASEQSVLEAITLGLTRERMARRWGVGIRAVNDRVAGLRERFGVESDAALVARAHVCGMVSAHEGL